MATQEQNWWEAYPEANSPTPQSPPSGPLASPPARADKPPEPKTTYRTLSPDEVSQRGLPEGTYQISSEGKVDPIGSQPKVKPEQTDAQRAEAERSLRETIDKLDALAFDAADNNGWGETGFTGSIMRNIPGTAARDLSGAITSVQANTAFDKLQNLKQNSPNGGGLGGNTSDADMALLKSSVANLDQTQSQDSFFGQVAQAKKSYLSMLKQLNPAAAEEYAKRKGIRFDEAGNPTLYYVDGADPRAKRDPFGVLPDQSPPEGGGGGGGYSSNDWAQGLKYGLGDIAQGAGNVIGVALNPVNATINKIAGTNLSTDAGTALRETLGLPENPNKIASAINQTGVAALSGAGLARGAATIANPGALRSALSIFGKTPIADTVAGAAAGGASEEAKQADMGLAGQVGAGILGGMAGYAGARGVAARALGERAPKAVMKAADDLGVQMLPADVGGVGTRMATGGFGRTFGGIPIAEGAQKSIDSAALARNRIANEIGTVSDNVGAGQAVRRGFEKFGKGSKDRADELYSQVSIPAESNVQLNNTRTALAEVTQGLRSNPELSKLWAGHPRLKASLEALTPTDTSGAGQVQFRMASQKLTSAQESYDQLRNQVVAPERLAQARKAIEDARNELDEAMIAANRPPEGGQLSWADMNRFRSIVGEIIGQPGVKRDGSDIAALRKLYGALTSDMEATASQAGPRALQEFRRANQYWRGREARIDDVFSSLLGKDNGRSDEAVFKQINQWAQTSGGDFNRVARAIRSMPKDEADTVRATIVQRMGLAPARRQDVTQEVFSPAEFAAQWNGMSPRAKSVLFPNQNHRNDLDKLADLMDRMKRAGEYQNFSNTSLGVNVTAQGTLAYANFPAAAVLALGQFGVGKLLASPRFARAIASTYQLPEAVAARKLTEQLEVLATREPLLANDVKAVLDYVNKSVSQSPVRAAATEEEQDGRRVPPKR